MKFTYRSTLVNQHTKQLKNHKIVLDTDTWLHHVRSDNLGLYGNSADIIEKHVLPLLEGERLNEMYSAVFALYEQWRKNNGIMIFEFAMFVWAGFKKGQYSADVWATILSIAWQSGTRGMMAAMVLNSCQVIEMFRAAPKKILLGMGEFEDEDLNKQFDELPGTFTLVRGVSTGIDHFEDGFSWTFDLEEAKKFSTLNCQNKKEIPGFIVAEVRKEAVLAMFSYESEVVIDPTIPKVSVQKYFLRGKELRDFHKGVDVEANTQDVLLRTGYNKKHMNEGVSRALQSAPRNGLDSLLGLGLQQSAPSF